MELTKVLPNGLQHGLINTVGNSVPDNDFKRFSPKDREKMKKDREESERIVEAQFLHKEGKQERLERPYMMWEGQPITTWRFIHGHTYFLPKGLVDDVNSPHKRQKKRTGLLNHKNEPLMSDEWDEPVYRFVPVGF